MKKIISLILGVFLFTIVFSTLAFADTKTDKAYDKVAKIDVKILQMVDEAQVKVDNLLKDNNYLLAADVTDVKLKNKINKIIADLVDRTNSRVQEIKNIAEKKTLKVIFADEIFYIGGIPVTIDPCRTISD